VTETKTAFVAVRGQHSRGSTAHTFGGPDTYVAVQIVPVGTVPLVRLDRRAAARRGITLEYVGEGYQRHSGPRSSLGRALARAEARAAAINAAGAEGANAAR
jgi:hypothetical protein